MTQGEIYYEKVVENHAYFNGRIRHHLLWAGAGTDLFTRANLCRGPVSRSRNGRNAAENDGQIKSAPKRVDLKVFNQFSANAQAGLNSFLQFFQFIDSPS
jgi:hypothetical protein